MPYYGQGQDLDVVSEALALDTKFKRAPKTSVIKINNILIKHLKNKNARESIMNKASKF